MSIETAALVGCHGLGMNLAVCERDLWLVGKGSSPDGLVRFSVDPRDVLQKTVSSWHSIWLRSCVVLSDPLWLFASSKASLPEEKVTAAFTRLKEEYLLKAVKCLSRGVLALKHGSMSSTGLWVMCGASFLLFTVALGNAYPLGATHLWGLIRDRGLLDTKHINAVSWGLGLKLAAENSVTRRMDALTLLLQRSGRSSELQGIQGRASHLVQSGRVAEAYALLGIRFASISESLLSRATFAEAVDARPEEVVDMLCSILGIDFESGKLFFRALNVDVDKKESSDTLEILRELASFQARNVK